MRLKLGLGLALLAVALAGAVGVAWVCRRPAPQREAHPEPAYTPSPYLTTRADARHVGVEACRECHKSRHQSYLHTAHSRALSEVDVATEPPDGRYEHKASGRSYRAHRDGKVFRHEEVLRTPEGKEIGRLDLPVRYAVGGVFART